VKHLDISAQAPAGIFERCRLIFLDKKMTNPREEVRLEDAKREPFRFSSENSSGDKDMKIERSKSMEPSRAALFMLAEVDWIKLLD